MADKKPVLDVRSLAISLPPHADRELAVAGASFSVDAGELVCLVGESGSGKSVIAFTVLAINIMGDGLRDTLDPKMSKKV